MKNLKNIIKEAVHHVLLSEARSIKSRKLQQIISQHGGLGRHGNDCNDLHNMSDDDIICVMPPDKYHALWDKKYTADHWRWADNFSLDVWAKNQGIQVERGDRIEGLELNDGYYLIFINRNESCVNDYKGERGVWKDYYDKREERKRNRYMDGKNRYIPKHRRPFDYDRVWKNPYRKSWKKDDVNNMMQNIRDYNMDIERPTNY